MWSGTGGFDQRISLRLKLAKPAKRRVGGGSDRFANPGMSASRPLPDPVDLVKIGADRSRRSIALIVSESGGRAFRQGPSAESKRHNRSEQSPSFRQGVAHRREFLFRQGIAIRRRTSNRNSSSTGLARTPHSNRNRRKGSGPRRPPLFPWMRPLMTTS